MARILTEHAAFPVCWAEEGEYPRAGQAYLAPPGRHLLVCPDGTLSLPRARKIGLGRPSADRLFQSLARRPSRQTLAVVLSGFGQDGSHGVRALKEAGGVTLAQEAGSSEFPDMPRNAAATGCIDYVLPLAEIGPKLAELTHKMLAASQAAF